jgi:hypothetical protein
MTHFEVVHTIFDNNPYIDAFIDSFEGEVFNDHYRIMVMGCPTYGRDC